MSKYEGEFRTLEREFVSKWTSTFNDNDDKINYSYC